MRNSMPKSELCAENLSTYNKIVWDLLKTWDTGVVLPWFRGQTNSEWPLVPQFYRMIPRDPQYSPAECEDEMREEFVIRAPLQLDVRPTNKWSWYVLMRHHGIGTRLLDWTEGALLALHFAVRDNEGDCDAAVWALEPWELNRRVLGRKEVIPVGEPEVSEDDQALVEAWLPDRFPRRRRPLRRPPVAIYPTYFEDRIGAQRSCLTIHGRDPNGLHNFHGSHEFLKKIVIPSAAIQSIRESLQAGGVDDVTVFPDLDGLGRAMNSKWLSGRPPSMHLPHSKVYARIRPSKHHGVGVFAIRHIKAGAKLFDGDDEEMIWINEGRIRQLPKWSKRLYADFAVIKDGKYGCPTTFNRLTIGWYLNESRAPNVRCDDQYDFFAARDIKGGEELTVDYSSYSERSRGLGGTKRNSAKKRLKRS
jgi:hypothetical protein